MIDRRMGPSGQARAYLVAAVAVLMLIAAPAAQALPGNFWGVSPQGTPSPEQFKRLRTGGVDSVRIPISWAAVQPNGPGEANFAAPDLLVAGAAAAGIEVLPFVYDAPSWAVPRAHVPGPGNVKAPKTLPVKSGKERSSWANFLKLVVAHYGPGGSFWAFNPALPARPIRAWQIWNEENFKYFVVRPNPVDYGKLINISYSAIKAADSGAKLILGGMFAEPGEADPMRHPPQAYFATDFLNQVYRSTPGVKRKFVGVALHPYTGEYQRLTPEIEKFRHVLAQNHDAGKGLWITEVGWSSEHPSRGDSFAKGPAGQATQLKGAFNLFKSRAAKWRLKQIFWFSVDDAQGICNFCGGSGLFGEGFTPKKAWFAYVHFAGGRPG